jgi:hypothetical protein
VKIEKSENCNGFYETLALFKVDVNELDWDEME